MLDYNVRERILFGEDYKPENYRLGGIRSIRGLNYDTAMKLLNLGFIDLEEAQNCSPTIREFLEFMKNYPGVTAHGYAISPERTDVRITFEGLEYEGDVNSELMIDFVNAFHYADDFSITNNSMYCWWD